METPLERRTVHYSGNVQGVGFRYTALRAAHGRPVAGFVRNLANGEVEITVEGSRESIDRFLGAVERAMARNIQDVRTQVSPATGEFDSFEIGY